MKDIFIPILYLPMILAFAITVTAIPFWIKKIEKIGIFWEDMNKFDKRKIAGSGGVVVLIAVILSVLFYISLKTFYYHAPEKIPEIFALTTSLLFLGLVGLIDDLFGWWHGGLSKRIRIMLCILASIPLVVINATNPSLILPFTTLNLGLFYLFLIPIAITGTTATFNFLAGMNGLEAGQGIIMLLGLSFVTYFTGITWVSLIGLCMVAALLAFLWYNKYPAKVFPGDVLTYSVGGLIGIMTILGNIEMIALFFFIPYILEVGLKLRGKLKMQSFAKPNEDNSLEMLYDKIYGLTHLSLFILKKFKSKVYEKEVVFLIWAFQVLVIIIGIIIFRGSIFLT
jgi:UDP-N-acetylglucosamine--dolichyl-phosphate N-acetylglucosaminephosphotransferase